MPPIVIAAAMLAALAGVAAEFGAERPSVSAAGTTLAAGVFLILAAVVDGPEFVVLYAAVAVLLGVLGVGAVQAARRAGGAR